jgi:hypothetical protein
MILHRFGHQVVPGVWMTDAGAHELKFSERAIDCSNLVWAATYHVAGLDKVLFPKSRPYLHGGRINL